MRRESTTMWMHSPPFPLPETQPLRRTGKEQVEQGQAPKNYGSFITTPSRLVGSPEQDLTPLKLPGPALSPAPAREQADQPASNEDSKKQAANKDSSPTSDAYHVGPTQAPQRKALTLPRHLFRSNRTASTPQAIPTSASPFLKRMLSGAGPRTPQSPDVPLEAYRELDSKQDHFFSFLDKELDKIESFYSMKEEEASKRLHLLRAQLHEMRDRRMDEVLAAQKNGDLDKNPMEDLDMMPNGTSSDHGPGLFSPLEGIVPRWSKAGKSTDGMTKLGSPSVRAQLDHEARQDYVKRVDHSQRVPYRSAKRKLKLALQEYYRGLELLKSYVLVNRTAFRKINKKYDKAMNARPTGRYMAEKVNKTHFVKSDTVDNLIVAVEDLYARYFERGNRKVAVGKLRSKLSKSGDYSQTSFRNGIWLAAGAALGLQGMVYGFQHLNYHGSLDVRLQTSYLLQLYGGYFLGVVIFLLFALDCRMWTSSKINYVFVFEYDSRHVLDWRELAELPSLFLFLEGLFIWLNFRRGGEDAMYIYWPVILIGLTLIIMCIPLPILYHRSRRWWGYSNWRLLLAGLYPVEFRDFFVGDMYCSLTYTMGNISLFFCLYAQHWSDPPRCNSTHSRLLGFFATLPAIWRALQCIRRYYDSRNWFPHLANCGKYTFSVLYYMSLSLYRIDQTPAMRGLFIFFATINAIYCSVWDIAMDWSLGNPYAAHPYLRDTLGYRRVWIYYVAMVVDPLLRFTWIFYAIFGHETQHSTLVSFIIALAEVSRRGMWASFRVENEHCTNVGRFRASRDVPLPYSLESSRRASEESAHQVEGQSTTGADLEQNSSNISGSLRLRRSRVQAATTPVSRGLHRVGTMINQAHAQDFERKNRAGIVGKDSADGPAHRNDDSSDDDDDDDDDENDNPRDEDIEVEDVLEARDIIDRAQA
jgi:xenotropic and polytropic retrovirus receptor 1